MAARNILEIWNTITSISQVVLVYLNGNKYAAEGENNIKYAPQLPYELSSEELICTRL